MPEDSEPRWRRDAEAHADLYVDLQRERRRFMSEHQDQMHAYALHAEAIMCDKVRRLREERGWSQAELARRLGELGFEMHQTTVAKLESGKRPLRVAEMYALAVIFGIPPAAIWYMPGAPDEDFSTEHLTERLESLDKFIQDTERQMVETVGTFARTYAEFSAERLLAADLMRQAAAEGERRQTASLERAYESLLQGLHDGEQTTQVRAAIKELERLRDGHLSQPARVD